MSGENNINLSIRLAFESQVVFPFEGPATHNLSNFFVSPFFGFGEESWNPHSACLAEYKSNKSQHWSDSILAKFYRVWAPKSLQDLFDISLCETHEHFACLDTNLRPWLEEDASERHAKTRATLRTEFSPVLRKFPKLELGHPQFGPMPDQQIQFEYTRTTEVFQRIQTLGYRQPKFMSDTPRVEVLQRGDEYRFIVLSGKHRFAALSVLEKSSWRVPVICERIIRREDADSWKKVLDGLWPKQSALDYFDSLFDGNASSKSVEQFVLTA